MRGLVGLTCLCWLLASVGQTVQVLSSGHSYTYEYQTVALSGIPGLENQYSALSLLATLNVDVVSPKKAVFWIKDVRSSKLNEQVPVSYAEDIEFQHTPSPQYEQELSKPFVVYFEENLVTKIEAAKSDPTWSVNIKKAIAEKFQLDLKPKPGLPDRANPNQVPRIDPATSIYTTYEHGIQGECETRYSILSVPSLDHPDQSEDVLNVTKVKSYRNCRSRVILDFDNFEDQGCSLPCEPRFSPQPKSLSAIWRESSSTYESGCHFGFEPDHHPVKSYAITWYNISGTSYKSPLIEGIQAEGKTVYNLYGEEIMVVAMTNITLLRRKALRSTIPKLNNPVRYDSLEYEWPTEEYLDDKDSSFYAILGPVHVPQIKESALHMLESLVNDIIPTEPETSQSAGPKVIQLVNVIDILNRPELEELYQALESDKIQKVPRKQQLMRKVFLDILAISATDEVALFVRDLIVSKRVFDYEAAELIEGIGKNSDEPGDEVIEAYLELLERPRIQQSRRLLPVVAITLGKMIDDACDQDEEPKAPQQFKPKEHIRHPRAAKRVDTSSEESEERVPKRKNPKPHEKPEEDECSPEDLKKYISKLSQRLREVKTFRKMLVYIEALAHIGTPEVLPILKPYVTGEAPNAEALDDEDTDFLATNALFALHHVADDYPEEVLPIAASIYFDPSEDYDQRIAAFSVLMACDPPLNLLERVVVEMNSEINNQVGSYAYSLLSDIANSTLPCDRKMAQKAQLVLAHAPDFDLGLQYSNTYQYTLYDDDNDYGVSAQFELIASNVSSKPRGFYASIDPIQASFIDSFLEVGGTMKGVDELIDKLLEPSGILTQILSHLGSNVQLRNVPQVLDIIKNRLLFANQDTDTPRGVFYYKLFGRISYLTWEMQDIVQYLEDIVEYFKQIDISTGVSGHYVKVWMPGSFVRAVPSSVGLPVAVSHRRPIILTVSFTNARVSTTPQKQVPRNTALAFSTDFDISLHMHSLGMAYFVSPAYDQIHGAAFEKTTEIAFANTLEVVVDLEKNTHAVSLKPKIPHEIYYHNSRPVTFIGEATLIRQAKEEWLGDANEIETVPEPFKYDERHESHLLGMSLRVVGDSESPWLDLPLTTSDTADEDGILAAFIEMAVNPEMINRELHVYLEPHRKSPASEIVFTADYDTHLKMGIPKRDQESDEESSEEEEYEKAVSSIYGHGYNVPDAESTIEKLVKRTQATWAPILGQGYSDPVPATVAHVLDLTMVVKGQRPRHHAMRLLYAHSIAFRSNWFEVTAHSTPLEHEKPFQFCSSLCAVYPEMPNPFYLQMNTLKSQRVKFEGEIGWGTDCQRQSQIRINGVMEKSEEQLTTSSGTYESKKDQQTLPWYYKQCQVDKTEGQTQSYACQQAISEDSQLNVIKFDVIAPHLPPELKNATFQLDLLAKYLWYSNLEVNPLVNNPEDRCSIEIHYSEQVPEAPLIDIEINKPTERIVFSKLYWPYFEPPSTLDYYEETLMDQFFDDDYYPECNLMEDFLNTFDNVTLELPDNKCQYILAHDSSPDRAYTIIASQIDFQAKTKALSMVLADHSVKVLPPRGEAVPIVLDGKELSVTPRNPIILDFDKESELRIYVRLTSAPTETPILVLRAPDDDITVKYDGKNAMIKLPREFQGDQVGLCGDLNDEEFHEFTGPHGCTWLEEEDFAYSFAIPGQSCPQPPRPRGPAFCPPGVKRPVKKHSEEENSDEDQPRQPRRPHPAKSSEEDDEKPYRPRPKHPKHSAESWEEPGKKHPARPHKESWEEPGKHPSRPHKESWEEPSKHPVKPHKHPRTTQESDESDEDDKPTGTDECVKMYTHTFQDEEGRTCFATQPVYKCHPECRPIRPKHKPVPHHCMPSSKYEKILKEQARHGLVTAVQNKQVDKTKHVEIPDKCL